MARTRRESRTPWIEATAGVSLGLAVGAAVAVELGSRLAGVATAPVPFPDSWTYHHTATSLLTIAVIGAVVGAAGVYWRAERLFFNYCVIGLGLGALLLGTSFLAFEQVEVTPDAVARRSWWGLHRLELRFADMRLLQNVSHHRPWRRNSYWESLHYELQDGRKGAICENTARTRLLFWAKLHVLHSAGKRGVEIRQEHDYGS